MEPTSRELRALAGHSAWVHGVAVSPDGRRAVSASGDTTLKVWDLGRERWWLPSPAMPLCCAAPSTVITGSLPATGPAGSTSIQEFRVLTNTFDAEFGRNSGAVVNVVSRQGQEVTPGGAPARKSR